jgi:YfiH family protein
MSELEVVTHRLLEGVTGIRHAFFTRRGGVSTGVYSSLNVGRGSKDDSAAVAENRRRAAAHMGVEVGSLLTCYQIHSPTAHVADAPWGDERREGDAVATRMPGLVCGALAADCAPVLLADPEAGVVGAAHAGWKGALGGVVESVVAAMESLGADAGRMVAVVGPCIGPQSYEVGLDFLDAFTARHPEAARFFRPGVAADKRMFDLPAYVLDRLDRAGVRRAAWVGQDTYADEHRFFSNRRAVHRGEADYGRLLSAIRLT